MEREIAATVTAKVGAYDMNGMRSVKSRAAYSLTEEMGNLLT